MNWNIYRAVAGRASEHEHGDAARAMREQLQAGWRANEMAIPLAPRQRAADFEARRLVIPPKPDPTTGRTVVADPPDVDKLRVELTQLVHQRKRVEVTWRELK